MNKKIQKTLTVFVCLLMVSSIGFSTVHGYGGSSSGGRSGGSSRTVPTLPTQASPVAQGAVLGELTFAFNTNLRMGMRSDEVKELQERLRAEGFFTFRTSTGYFGPITDAAVKAYQKANPEIGYVTGLVGPLTRAALNK